MISLFLFFLLTNAYAENWLCESILDRLPTDPHEIVGSSKWLGNGAFSNVYCYQSPDGPCLAAKIYGNSMSAESDQRTLEYLRRHADQRDSVTVTASILRDRIMWMPYLDGQTLGKILESKEVTPSRRRSLLTAYHRYQVGVAVMQSKLHGEEVKLERVLPLNGNGEVWWVSSELKPARWQKYGPQYIIPHPENVLVEKGNSQMWLIDPR